MQRRDIPPELSFAAPPAAEPRELTSPPTSRRQRGAEPEVVSVAELDRRLKRILEGSTADVRVEGEISGLRVVGSGHAYFTLKDESEEAAIDCVMYRTAAPRARKLLADGARVVLTGRATVYVPRGRLQFCADDARLAGRGALLEALFRLKEKLAAEGLFAPERKRKLPVDPQIIGVVTSGDGAAIHDIVTVAFRRGAARLILARTPVQGAGAGQRIVRAIALLEEFPGIEVIIVGRGGGSADDLSAFNEEIVVRKVAAARVPIVSAVGHEIDVALTDLAADARAATPSQAAEMLVADAAARRAALEHLEARMRRAIAHRLRAARADLDRQRARLGSPAQILAEPQQRIDDAVARLRRRMERILVEDGAGLQRLERRLAARHPRAVLAGARGALRPLSVRLAAAARRHVALLREGFASDVARLEAMSPLRVLARGYAIATDRSGRAVRDHREVAPGDPITVRVHHGALLARVVVTAGPDEPLVERGAPPAPAPPAPAEAAAPAPPARQSGGPRAPAAGRAPRRRAQPGAPACEQLGLGFAADERAPAFGRAGAPGQVSAGQGGAEAGPEERRHVEP
ncbi:exodeoxyribonuclease VII large subunit [Sorangium sp. So ce861]|uniref:exodeoxyribonuclease VII large subunit n=1 Tax=Sorangium sp. So ce861 TaxID=3133323 RepID=UPI003F60762A